MMRIKNLAQLPVALPLMGLGYLALASYPMMYPGFDVWIHMSRIEYQAAGWRVWYDVWRAIFDILQMDNVFDRALLIHRFQTIATLVMVGISAYWVLLTVFAKTQVPKTVLVLQALCAVWIWLVMHGTVSVPVAGDRAFIQSWWSWYSVNYQITLPVYFLSASAIVLAALGSVSSKQRIGLVLLAVLGALFIGKVHPSELPYLLFAVLWVVILGFKRNLAWLYLAGILLAAFLLFLVLKMDGRLPAGFSVLQSGGVRGLFDAVVQAGEWMTTRGNRGQASFNYYHYMGLSATVVGFYAALRLPLVNQRAVWFVLLSAVPVLSLFAVIPAGVLAMVTYHEIAWRFNFSSFLFMGLPILVVVLALTYNKLMGLWPQLVLTGGTVFAVMLASYAFEPHHIALQNTRSIFHSLSAERVYFGFSPKNQAWLEKADQALRSETDQGPVCADAFSAYYLFFVNRQHRMILPGNIELHPGNCRFPRDGGDLKRLPMAPPPWTF